MLGFLLLSPPAWAEEKKIEIHEYLFVPANLTITVGTKVTWINHDEVPHTVNATDKKFNSPALDTDEVFSTTFTEPGTYRYFCRLHSQMTGTITVVAAK